MLCPHGALVCTQKPAFEQAGDEMTVGEEVVSNVTLWSNNLMAITEFVKSVVPLPSVGVNCTAWGNRLLNDIQRTRPDALET